MYQIYRADVHAEIASALESPMFLGPERAAAH
jgi:hypothetical protein